MKSFDGVIIMTYLWRHLDILVENQNLYYFAEI